jgi:hypothetical protein
MNVRSSASIQHGNTYILHTCKQFILIFNICHTLYEFIAKAERERERDVPQEVLIPREGWCGGYDGHTPRKNHEFSHLLETETNIASF